VSPAASFVKSDSANHNELLALAQPLGMDGGSAADHADRRQLGDLVSNGHQVGNGTEGLIREGGVKTGEDDALAQVHKLKGERKNGFREKLHLVDSNHFNFIELGKERSAKLLDRREL